MIINKINNGEFHKITYQDVERLDESKLINFSCDNYKDFQFFWSKKFGLGVGEIGGTIELPIFSQLLQNLDTFIQQRQVRGFKKEPLFKSLGPKHNGSISDATFGLGKDSMYFLSCGLKVEAFERDPVVYLISKTYLNLNQTDDRLRNLKFHFGNSSSEDITSELIYFDPMYSSTNDKALPNKNMRIFRSLVVEKNDDAQEADVLLRKCRRLIVKRPIKAPMLLSISPQASFEGKSTRYDVYINHQYISKL